MLTEQMDKAQILACEGRYSIPLDDCAKPNRVIEFRNSNTLNFKQPTHLQFYKKYSKSKVSLNHVKCYASWPGDPLCHSLPPNTMAESLTPYK